MDKTVETAIANRILLYRKDRQLSQQTFAEQCDISIRYLSQIENGSANPTLSMMKALSAQLGTTVSQLTDTTQLPDSADGPP